MEPIAKRLKVTFHSGLPVGTHANFVHDGQVWIAMPAAKYLRVVTVTDRLLGTLSRIKGQVTRWVGTHPENAETAMRILNIIAEADDAAHEKIKAQTS